MVKVTTPPSPNTVALSPLAVRLPCALAPGYAGTHAGSLPSPPPISRLATSPFSPVAENLSLPFFTSSNERVTSFPVLRSRMRTVCEPRSVLRTSASGLAAVISLAITMPGFLATYKPAAISPTMQSTKMPATASRIQTMGLVLRFTGAGGRGQPPVVLPLERRQRSTACRIADKKRPEPWRHNWCKKP